MGAFSAWGPGAKDAIVIVLVLAVLLLPVTVVLIVGILDHLGRLGPDAEV